MGLTFEWDAKKARRNLRKHRVSFEEAATVFGDPFSLTIEDPLHSEDEDRFVIIGESLQRRILVVAHAEWGDNIRIISARVATRHERESYEEGGADST
jgi:uncharacterized DUF497 family protein